MSTATYKRLVFIAPSAYPLGGVQNWLDYLLPGLEQAGYQVTLALTSGQHHNVANYLDTHKIDRLEIIENQSGTAQGRVDAIEAMLFKTKPDLIVVVNIVDAYQAINNLRRSSRLAARIVTSLHGIDLNFLASINNNSRIIDAVISTNRLTQKLINATSGLDEHRSLYAPYGVDFANPERPIDMLPREIRSTESCSVTLAYAGRFDEDQKRFSDALAIFTNALDQINNLSLIIAGNGPSKHSLDTWLEQNPEFSHRVSYLGVVKPEDVSSEVYQKADLLLLSSEWETGPIVAWEAMSHGVCFVSSRYRGHVEEQSLRHGYNCLLFDIGDIDGAVEQIKLACTPSMRTQLLEGGLALVKEKYTQKKSIASWASCFEQILAIAPRSFSKESVATYDNGRATPIAFAIFGLRGLKLLEKLRRILGIRKAHCSPGSEWPHSYINEQSDARLKRLEKIIERAQR